MLLFLCDWDSRAKTLHYLKRDWPQRKYLKVGEKNVQRPALAEWHKNPATAPKHQTRSDEKLPKSHGPDWPRLSEAKIKKGFLWVLRSASSSETICSTTYFRVTSKKLGTRFVRCQLTSSGISRQKTTRN